MSESTVGASVQAVATRVAVLEIDGVPLPGAGHLYTTDSLVKLDLTPVMTKGVDIEKMNAAGALCVNYKQRDVLKRFDAQLELCTLDPELEVMLVGGETFASGGLTIGASAPKVGVVEVPYGVSVEVWTRHIINGDLDPVWPFVHWVIPRSYWGVDKVSFMNDAMPRLFNGFTSENPNWFNGPANDWVFNSDRSWAYAYAKTVPTPVAGAQTLGAS